MLINNVSTESRASLIVKNSEFYIDVAKFVQAYTTIVKNPNEFLREINKPEIDKENQHLSWDQFAEIMMKCDFGFGRILSRMDLVIMYNYALEIGSVDSLEKKIASVNDVAEAQKHYYNFVDDAKDRAEEAYQKQKRISENRARELGYVDGQLAKIRAKNWLSAIMMVVSILIGMVGAMGFFLDNTVVSFIGKLLSIGKPRVVGGIVLIVMMFLLFMLFNNIYVKTKRDFIKLNVASIALFEREKETSLKEHVLKSKLDALKKDYAVVRRELNDKNKKYDVKHNIDMLKTTNKYYKELCQDEESLSMLLEQSTVKIAKDADDDFAPIKLTKDQEENMRGAKNSVISLQGQFDTEAYNEKFETSKEERKAKEERKEQEQKEQEEKAQKEQEEKEQEIKKAQDDAQEMNSVNEIRQILGANNENNKTQEK